MKSIAFLSVLAAGSVLAGEKAVLDKSPVTPPPSLYSWFAGGTVGYLLENEEEMYTGHLGIDLPNKLGGWDQAIYLEIGYAELSGCANYGGSDNGFVNIGDGGLGDYSQVSGVKTMIMDDYKRDSFGFLFSQYGRACFDLEIVPVTINYKLEKPLTEALNCYISAGAGVAFIDAEADIGPSSDDDDDTVFYAQLAAGVLYEVNPSFELFAGARLIYFDEPEFTLFGSDLDLGDIDDAGYEVENTDVLIEAGGRMSLGIRPQTATR